MAADPKDLATVDALKAYLGIGGGEVIATAVSAGGSGYVTVPTVTFGAAPAGGRTATGLAVLAGTVVSKIALTDPGKGYTVAPSVTIGGPGTGAAATCTIAGIDSAGDNLFQTLITAASAYFYTATSRRVFLTTTVTEVRDGHGELRLMMREFPIQSITSVTVGITAVPVSTAPNIPGHAFDTDSIFVRGYTFDAGSGNVTVVYSAGYGATINGSPELQTIAQAVIELAASRWKRREHIDQASQSLGGVQTVSFSTKDVPAEVQTVINRFSRMTL